MTQLFQVRDDLIINVREIQRASPDYIWCYGGPGYSGSGYSITPEQWEQLKKIANPPPEDKS